MSLANLKTAEDRATALRVSVGMLNKIQREYGDDIVDEAITEFQTAREVAFVQGMSDRQLNEVHTSLSLLERLSGKKRDRYSLAIKAEVDRRHEASIIRAIAEKDPDYAPYCMRCTGAVRMKKVEPFLWNHHCGAIHDERR